MKHTGITQRLCHLSRHRQVVHRRDQPQDQASEPRADDGGLRDLPRGEQLHQLRRHGDEAHGYQHRLHDLSRRSASGTLLRRDAAAAGSGHIPTNADCVSCHASTAKFGPGTAMNHAPVAGTPCATCHETGKSFTGVTIVTRPTAAQDPNHPPTGDCGTCHSSTTSFATGVTGKPANHIPTTQACTLCHTSLPASYKPGVMNHAGISSGCTTCHAVGASGTAFYGVTPLPQGSGHIPTNADCVTCHASTAKFGPGTAMSTPASRTRLCDLSRHRQDVHRRDQSQDQAGEPRADDGGLRDLPRGRATSPASPARR